ncbi:fam-a protein [Plasmodium vinckei vinckei]|uniref:Fam-a protein n=1 Tax=Plasmodium vinckei vinckei TaxID=54757 RepID=A0A449BZ87_PLAVN|nr:fam-a protein [Plasmodium vinckei vinckei]VEV58753.1 fam-a protein [Plasmodium vinckei vinckei]
MNKFYIQIALFILSIFAYANNEALAADPDLKKVTQKVPKKFNTIRSRGCYLSSEEIYEKCKYLSCRCRNPTRVINIMNDAVKQLEYYATTKDGYEPYLKNPDDKTSYYVKKFDNQTNIDKIQYTITGSDKYDETVDTLWDSGVPNIFNEDVPKILHMYGPNLLVIRERFKSMHEGRDKYFYALVTKVEISKDKTIIAMTSINGNDDKLSNIKYNNPIIKKASLFNIYIKSKDDIKKESLLNTSTKPKDDIKKESLLNTSTKLKDDIKSGKLEQIFVNLAGYLIEKKRNNVEVTYIESIQGYSSI